MTPRHSILTSVTSTGQGGSTLPRQIGARLYNWRFSPRLKALVIAYCYPAGGRCRETCRAFLERLIARELARERRDIEAAVALELDQVDAAQLDQVDEETRLLGQLVRLHRHASHAPLSWQDCLALGFEHSAVIYPRAYIRGVLTGGWRQVKRESEPGAALAWLRACVEKLTALSWRAQEREQVAPLLLARDVEQERRRLVARRAWRPARE